MADIIFHTKLKKNIEKDNILIKIEDNISEFNLDNINNESELLSRLYEIKWKDKKHNINLDIVFLKSFFDKSENIFHSQLNIFNSERYNLEGRLNFLIEYKNTINSIRDIYEIDRKVRFEIWQYIYWRPISWIRQNTIIYNNNIFKEVLSDIEEIELLKILIRRWWIRDISILEDLFSNNRINEKDIILKLLKISNKLGKINISEIVVNDIFINYSIPINILLDFLILKINESNSKIKLKTDGIEELFKNLIVKLDEKSEIMFKFVVGLLFIIIVINFYFYKNSPWFEVNDIGKYIPMLLIELLLFKFLFFFLERYNMYSKISSLYEYYKWLVQFDKIYTEDEKFDIEQRFALREKTYNELTNLSSHVKWLVDKQWTGINDLNSLANEIKNISPILRNLNK